MESLRYNRQTILPQIGLKGQEKLQNAKVLLVGIGGLGAAILPYLVGAGIGEIGLVDQDLIAISNLHRQVIYQTNWVGKSKVSQAKEQAIALNPNVKINTLQEQLSPENALLLFEYYDLIVDGTDNLITKYLINDACCVLQKPFVYGSVYQFEGQVSVFNYKNGPTYRCLFPEEKAVTKNCTEAGVLGTSVGIIGMLQANEVLKFFLEIGEVLSGKILIYNTLNNSQQEFQFSKNNQIVVNAAFFEAHYGGFKKTNFIQAIQAKPYISQPDYLFLDVRQPGEKPEIKFKNSIQIPLHELEKQCQKLDKEKEIFVFCQSGIRSKQAVEILKLKNFTKLKTLVGGAIELYKV